VEGGVGEFQLRFDAGNTEGPEAGRRLPQVIDEGGLPDTGHTPDDHSGAQARAGLLQEALEPRSLRLPADQFQWGTSKPPCPEFPAAHTFTAEDPLQPDLRDAVAHIK